MLWRHHIFADYNGSALWAAAPVLSLLGPDSKPPLSSREDLWHKYVFLLIARLSEALSAGINIKTVLGGYLKCCKFRPQRGRRLVPELRLRHWSPTPDLWPRGCTRGQLQGLIGHPSRDRVSRVRGLKLSAMAALDQMYLFHLQLDGHQWYIVFYGYKPPDPWNRGPSVDLLQTFNSDRCHL